MSAARQADLFGDDFPFYPALERSVLHNCRCSMRIFANGYDVTDSMPLTIAELERQREETLSGQRRGDATILPHSDQTKT